LALQLVHSLEASHGSRVSGGKLMREHPLSVIAGSNRVRRRRCQIEALGACGEVKAILTRMEMGPCGVADQVYNSWLFSPCTSLGNKLAAGAYDDGLRRR
jgi:hypothetical protein